MKFLKNKNNGSGRMDENSKTHHISRNIFLFLLLAAISGAVIVYFYAQKPAQGIIKVAAQDQTTQNKQVDVLGVFTGKYLSFMYGSSYVLKSDNVTDGAGAVILEQAYLSENSAISQKIALTVRNLPTHNLDDCPDFQMRTLKPERYRKENFSLGDMSGTSFKVIDQGTFEKSFFLLHKDYLAIITLMAPALADEKLENEANSVIKSISWLK